MIWMRENLPGTCSTAMVAYDYPGNPVILLQPSRAASRALPACYLTRARAHVGCRMLVRTQGGVCVDLSRMRQVVRVDVEDMDCRVQVGRGAGGL